MKKNHLIVFFGSALLVLLTQLIIDKMSMKGFYILIPFVFIFFFNLVYVKRTFESRFLALIYNFIVYSVSVFSLFIYIRTLHSEHLSSFNPSYILKCIGLISILSFLNFLISLSTGGLSNSK